MLILGPVGKDEYDILLDVWEASARATHHFVPEDEFAVLKNMIVEKDMFAQADIMAVRDENKTILGFCGVAGESLDMIFIRPEHIGIGIGKMLMRYAIDERGVTKVEVNEQNETALAFYKHFGFNVVARSATDAVGMPYPLLYMER